ncbi:MAG: methylenetetrahydrofolate reductase [NAD(P)H] [Candidatus Margulisbacteria bacterium]|nr:methylenetetrahydrofolate reductase [NAD(P)H] [Candidatus Margulisiibacteriota bacterium]
MKVSEALAKGQPTLSFEFFPPKTTEQEEHLFSVLAQLKAFQPDFASVTYGAMGTTREKTFQWVKEIKERFKIDPVAHLTCISATKKSILLQLEQFEAIGVNNILSLRGDPPEGSNDFTPPADGFSYAKDLVAFIKVHKPEFCLGVAGYPEGHRESPSLERDTALLKEKVEAGADYIISQLFFDNRFFFDFLDRCRKAGIKAPIIPGIMPITSLKQLRKMTDICGATIPQKLLEQLEKHESDRSAVEKIGVEWAVGQCEELLGAEVPGIHYFVMNQSGPISQILKQLTFARRQ